jgi:hypothetical protein
MSGIQEETHTHSLEQYCTVRHFEQFFKDSWEEPRTFNGALALPAHQNGHDGRTRRDIAAFYSPSIGLWNIEEEGKESLRRHHTSDLMAGRKPAWSTDWVCFPTLNVQLKWRTPHRHSYGPSGG